MTATLGVTPARILVTGARGFIGAHVVEALGRMWAGAEVFSLDRVGVPSIDLMDETSVADYVAKVRPTHVVHAAGAHGRTPVRDTFLIHCVATTYLLRAVEKAGATPRWVHVGSAAQYGYQDPAVEPELLETHQDEPLGEYAVSKASQEQLVRIAARRGVIEPVYTRVFNPIGPAQQGAFLLASITEQLKKGDTVTLANLDSVRDFIDVRDLAEGVVSCLTSERVVGERLNLCSGRATSVHELVMTMAAIAGKHVEILVDPATVPRPEIPYSRGSTRKTHELTSWACRYSLEASAKDIWAAS